MAFWWVSQNKTFQHESSGGYLWAPQTDSRGNTPYHWKNMEAVLPGDLIFSYVGQAIAAVSVALEGASPAEQPAGFEREGDWNKHGWQIPARYLILPEPVAIKTLPDELVSILKGEYRPLDVNGGGKQAYLFEIPPEAGRQLLEIVEGAVGADLDLLQDLNPGASKLHRESRETEREALAKSRIGQGRFKDDLMKFWGSKCALTGVTTACLLRASHSKPWKDSNNVERLNPDNGLLLAVGVDAAYDAGLITFMDSGLIAISPKANLEDLARIGITPGMRIFCLADGHLPFLAYHRQYVFQS